MADASNAKADASAATTPTYPVRLTKTEARLLIGMATNPEYERFEDYAETIAPLIEKLRAVL